MCLSLSVNTHLVFGAHTIVYKVNIHTLLKKVQVSLSSDFYSVYGNKKKLELLGHSTQRKFVAAEGVS